MEAYLNFSNSNIWSEIWPEMALALGALLILGIDLFRKNGSTSLTGMVAIIFQTALLIIHLIDYLAWHHTFDRDTFSGMLQQGIQGDIMRSFFLLSSLLVSILGHQYLKGKKLRTGEFHHLTMLATAGLMLLVQSNHFLMLFVALESVAVCFYTLVAYNRDSSKSLEAGIKYLIFGALSSSMLLFGIVLLYGVGSNPEVWGASYDNFAGQDPLGFQYLGNLLEANPDHLLLRAGVVLIIAGIAFKIGAAPFQIWVPDVYHGSPMPITAFLAVSSKAAGFFILINLVNGPFLGLSDFLLPLFGFIASFTILFGNLAACAQRNLKRMLGLSGVAHAGYLLVAVMASMHFAGDSDRAIWVLFFYLFIYLIASFSVFGVMGLAQLEDDTEHEFSHYEDLAKKHPWLGFVLVSGIGSLAGIPPFAGFVAKLLLISVAYQANLYFSLVAIVIGVAISIYYYFGWIREITFHPKPSFSDEDSEEKKDPWLLASQVGMFKICMLSLAIISIVLGLWQGSFGDAF
ncbi:MAG: NADH-quinone oxidoreductase subunit N [Opitutae bacterium]|jgi:NADH-quinone oxidoreductase subunit N|nr:NADH-quinone oxidoreductase subunit N [Opitutae bacterium]